MPKLKNPPQGGEKYLCLTLFATMAASVVSAVICIYCIVIIYKPSKEVLDSKIGKKCALYLVVGPVKLIFTFKGGLLAKSRKLFFSGEVIFGGKNPKNAKKIPKSFIFIFIDKNGNSIEQ